jgi:hypothetical protein
MFQNDMVKVAAELVTEEELGAKRSSEMKEGRAISKVYFDGLGSSYECSRSNGGCSQGLEKITIKEGELAGVEVLRGTLRKERSPLNTHTHR